MSDKISYRESMMELGEGAIVALHAKPHVRELQSDLLCLHMHVRI